VHADFGTPAPIPGRSPDQYIAERSKLEGKVSLVTGAGSGIGRAICMVFARSGARILAADLNADTAAETADMVTAAGGEAASHAVNVAESTHVHATVEDCVRCFGRVDVLCNNAGIGSTQSVVDTPEAVWDDVFAVNAKGTFLFCKYSIPHMLRGGGGVIVNTASVAGLIGMRNRAAYCAAKAAVISLTRSIAVDYATAAIRCNCICPGTVDSPWVERLLATAPDPAAERAALQARQPVGRLGTPDEIARAALYLASDDAAFVTGSSLVIDGGWTAQ
jgi:NAD(P)-dependent dehydrogenase (short-subunit alcohol dehydrogenase family)